MSFQKKYFFTFKPLDNKDHVVEIWQDTTLLITPTQIIGAVDPFVVTMSGLNDKLEPVRGSGADLNLFATSNLQYMDLYTANLQEYQVRHYIDGNLNWCGYLDTEIFSSDLSRSKNYNVAITANDGFALLDQMTYLQSNSLPFTGISSQYTILQYVISKISLPYNNIYIAISTTIPGTTIAASETIFNKTYVNNDNFYDEEGVPMTLREVLETILRPYGAFIIQSGGSLYITDIQSMVSASTFTFKKYDKALTYIITESTLNTLIGDLTTIKFAGPTQTLNIVPAYNKETVSYSPYFNKDVVDYNASDDFSTVDSSVAKGVYNYRWSETNWHDSKTFVNYPVNGGYFSSYNGLDGQNIGKKDYYLKINNKGIQGINLDGYGQTTTPTFTIKKQLPNLIGGNQYFIKLNIRAFFRKTDDLENPTDTSTVISNGVLQTKIQIGNKYFHNQLFVSTAPFWDTSNSNHYSIIFDSKTNPKDGTSYTVVAIENKWIDYKVNKMISDGLGGYKFNDIDYLIPLTDNTLNGVLSFSIYDYRVYNMSLAETTCLDCRIKDIKLTIVDALGNEVGDKDVEYVGTINELYKGEGNKIELKQGTNIEGFPAERGGLMAFDGSIYNWMNQFTRGGTSDNIENLLLRTYVGNYENKNIEINATVRQLPSNIGYLTYNAPLSGKKFMLTSFTNNYANNTSEITIQEVFADSLTINKYY